MLLRGVSNFIASVALAGLLALATAKRSGPGSWTGTGTDLQEESAGTRCSMAEAMQFMKRFRIGRKFDKPCSKEEEWGSRFEYVNPAQPDVIALYIYPKDDHNGAFGVCEEKKFDRVVCKRMLGQSDHYTVRFVRVQSVQEATDVVKALPRSTRIQHLVLGGHGDPYSLDWGDSDDYADDNTPTLGVDNPATEAFLEAVYPHLSLGADPSTVFMDACLNGKTLEEEDDKNMVNYVAHRLAGAKVFGSKISWNNTEFYLKDAKHFNASIIEEDEDKKIHRMTKAQFGEGPLRDWDYIQNVQCDDKGGYEPRVWRIAQCRQLCEKKTSDECKAFTWYPRGNGNPSKKCYLSKECDETSASTRQARVFLKP